MKITKLKKALSLIFIFVLANLSCFAGAAYMIKNPSQLENSSENIITDWDFYWGSFISPDDTSTPPTLTVKAPSDWNKYALPDQAKKIAKTGKGSGTYRLQLTHLKPNQNYAFPVYGLGYTAFEIYAGKKKIFQAGTPDQDWKKTQAEQHFDKAVFTSQPDGTALLTIHVSNDFYRKGGLRGNFTLYEEASYSLFHTRQICSYSIFSGILLMIVVYCLLNAILKKSRANLYLACLVLTIFSRIASYLFPMLKMVFPSFPFTMMLRIGYISVYFIPAFITLYINELNKNIFRHISVIPVVFPSLIFFILTFVLPIRIANKMVPYMQAYMFIVIGLASILFAIRIFKDHDFISITAIISFLVLAVGGIGDILLINHFSFLNGMHPITPSFLIFSLMQILLVAFIQNKNYLKTLELNDYLVETNKAYYRFVPKEFLELLSKKDITEVKPGDYKISRAAILSADIRNFTATSEKLAPIQVFDLLNTYLKKVAPLIRKYNGIIEKYLGDGIIAIFPDSAESALKCAVEMQEKMVDLRDEIASRGMPRIRIGIGIHYGNIVIGTGGNNDRMAEISLSKDIGIAVKIESFTKRCLRPILVTPVALRNAENEAREKGKPLTLTKEPIPLNSVTKISSANQMNVKNAVIFSICSDRMEEQL